MRGIWDALDLMTIRDAARHRAGPAHLAASRSTAARPNPRLVYNLGHAAFEFIEARYGKEGIRQFLYTFRKNIVGGGHGRHLHAGLPHEAGGVRRGLREVAEGALQALPRQAAAERLRQGPLARTRRRRPSRRSSPSAPSPSGEVVAALTGNRSEGEADLILLSAQDGTRDQEPDQGLHGRVREPRHQRRASWPGAPSTSTPSGDTVAFFAPQGQAAQPLPGLRARRRHRAAASPSTLDQAQAPCLLPDGKHACSSPRSRRASATSTSLDLETGAVKNLTAGRLRRHRPPDLAGREARRLHAAHQRPRQDLRLPARPPGAEDPAHLRHLRRQRADLLRATATRSSTRPPRTTTSTTCAASTCARAPSASTRTSLGGNTAPGAAPRQARRPRRRSSATSRASTSCTRSRLARAR